MTAPPASSTRRAVLVHVAARVAESHARRLAVDGVDGAGKTIFADELAGTLRAAGREVVRVSVDGFHQPRELRYHRGRASPEAFWLDSYDYDRFCDDVLAPFAPGGDRTYRRAIRDVESNQRVDVEPETASTDALLIVDGIFLHRDELAGCWDFSIFLDVGFDVTFARLARRDGFPADPAAPANRRYLEGQRLYLAACRPGEQADVVIDNTDPERPRLVGPRTGSAGTGS